MTRPAFCTRLGRRRPARAKAAGKTVKTIGLVPRLDTATESKAIVEAGHKTEDELNEAGIPFRDAHEIVGKAVAYGIESGKDLSDMTLQELQQFSQQISDDVFEVLTLEGSVAARDHIGGTPPNQVRAAADRAKAALAER